MRCKVLKCIVLIAPVLIISACSNASNDANVSSSVNSQIHKKDTLKDSLPVRIDNFFLHETKAEMNMPVIDMNNIKSQSYLHLLPKVDCDSGAETMIMGRICANLALQREDSLMRVELDRTMRSLRKYQDTFRVSQLKRAQQIWERYRFAHCTSPSDDGGDALRAIQFMRCATQLTAERRRNIRSFADGE